MGGGGVTLTAKAYLGAILFSGLFWLAVWWFWPWARVVDHDPGGNVLARQLDMLRVTTRRETIRIRGYCASACTLYLSLPRDLVCVYPSAKLVFHQASSGDITGLYPRWAQRWIAAQGGLSDRLIAMPVAYAAKHTRQCR